jgi:LacI family transcriptional regulator
MGYSRNASAAALVTRGQVKPARALDVAIISHFPLHVDYAPYECLAIQNRLAELGYQGHHYDIFHDHISSEKLAKNLFHQGYCGIIFDQIYEKESEVFSVDWSSLSLVCVGRTYCQPPCDVLRPNQLQMLSLAWREIRAAGHRRIGFVLSRHQPAILDDSEREAALSICQQTLPPNEEAIPPCLGGIHDQASFVQWFQRHRPDVVVGFNNLNHWWLLEMGLRVPHDVAYVNLQGDSASLKLATVDQCLPKIRIKAAEHLDFLIRHKRTGYPEEPWEMLGPVRWVPGESLPVIS